MITPRSACSSSPISQWAKPSPATRSKPTTSCAYCGSIDEPLQRDCVLPISRGGRYTLTNVVPACPSCNASKCNFEVTSWLRRKKLDEQAFLVRQLEIVQTLA